MLSGCLPDFSVACGRVAVLFVSAVGILFKGGNIMLHLIWYIIAGLIAGWAAKSLMHMDMSLMWAIGLGFAGSITCGLVSQICSRPNPGGPFYPAGLMVWIPSARLAMR